MALVRKVPEDYGTAQHQAVYSAIATQVYAKTFAPDFAYVHWRPDYELEHVLASYELAERQTRSFTAVSVDDLTVVLAEHPRALLAFRLLLGYTTGEFEAATRIMSEDADDMLPVTKAKARTVENGSTTLSQRQARAAAETIQRGVAGTLWPAPEGEELRAKIAKPDTKHGWDSVRELATGGVPLGVFLHQRHYGGAFRQLLDATSTRRGDVLEEAVEHLLVDADVPFVRTGSHNQSEIGTRFGLTVHPAPDFVFYDSNGALRGLLECKIANDGGTARDKAARFRALRVEASRLGGVPVFAMLSGLGWVRAGDALGPVVAACDGRVFTPATWADMLTVEPLPALHGLVS